MPVARAFFHDGDGVILGVLLVTWPGQSRGFWCGRMRSIGGIAIAPAIAALLWLAAAATVFDGLQATVLCAAGAGHGGCRARSISARSSW